MEREQFTNIRFNKNQEEIGTCTICNKDPILLSSSHNCLYPKKMQIGEVAIMKNAPEEVLLAAKYIRQYSKASSRKIPFTLSFRKFKQLMKIKYCQYTGVLLDRTDKTSPNYPSLERINSDEGYTDSNTIVCAEFINKGKNNLSPKEIESIYLSLKKKGVI
jgi:hypothetical protein